MERFKNTSRDIDKTARRIIESIPTNPAFLAIMNEAGQNTSFIGIGGADLNEKEQRFKGLTPANFNGKEFFLDGHADEGTGFEVVSHSLSRRQTLRLRNLGKRVNEINALQKTSIVNAIQKKFDEDPKFFSPYPNDPGWRADPGDRRYQDQELIANKVADKVSMHFGGGSIEGRGEHALDHLWDSQSNIWGNR